MPRKPKKSCAYPNCPVLTDNRFCDKHQKLDNKNYEKYKRNPIVKKRYCRAWKIIRDAYVREHPFCEICFKKGVMKKVEEVHHIKPLSERGSHNKEKLLTQKQYQQKSQVQVHFLYL